MSNYKLRVLIVDDSVFYRSIISDAIDDIEDAEVVGIANNGKTALNKIQTLNPDVITLDVEMPEMDGFETLKKVREVNTRCKVLMLSSLTSKGAEVTIKCLENGAFDFIEKPDLGNPEKNEIELGRQLKRKIHAIYVNKNLKQEIPVAKRKRNISTASTEEVLGRINRNTSRLQKVKMIGIGISTGGPAALSIMLPKIDNNIGVPIVIVQHMPPSFIHALVESLSKVCTLPVQEVTPNSELQANTIYIVPGDKQIKFQKKITSDNVVAVLNDDPPENFCRPSVDYLFREMAATFKAECLAVIMTGMGRDGTLGLKDIKQYDATVYGQTEESCVVYGMPMEANKAGYVDYEFHLESLAGAINKRVRMV